MENNKPFNENAKDVFISSSAGLPVIALRRHAGAGPTATELELQASGRTRVEKLSGDPRGAGPATGRRSRRRSGARELFAARRHGVATEPRDPQQRLRPVAAASGEPFDFGLRKANVGLARAVGKQASANEVVTKLDVSAAAADAFLTLLATDQTLEAAQAGVERAETLNRAVRALVANQLRPGVDASRAEAELASARNHLIQAEQNVELARADLAEAIGEAGADITIEPGPLLELPPAPPLISLNLALHPIAIAQTAAVSTSRAREKLLAHLYFPRFNWQTAIFGRGTGAKLDGTFDNGQGLYPNTLNWATGLSISFPVFDIFGLRAKRRAETNNTAAEEARYDQVINTLKTQEARARTLVESARRIAENMQVQVRTAQETMTRAKTRYEFGLADITEMTDAQRLLAQTEIDDSVAKIAVWRAMLAAAKLQGDLKPFLQQAAGKK